MAQDAVLAEGKIADSTNDSATFNAEQSKSRILRVKSREPDRSFGPLKFPSNLNQAVRGHGSAHKDGEII